MKSIVALFVFILCGFQINAQGGADLFEQSIHQKVALFTACVNQGDLGETTFWQTKGRMTFRMVNYSSDQEPQFRELFVRQYREILPLYHLMNQTGSVDDSDRFIAMLVKHEEEYRRKLRPDQLINYRAGMQKVDQLTNGQREQMYSLFFSDWLLSQYKSRFKLK